MRLILWLVAILHNDQGIILGFRQAAGPRDDSYYFGKINGQDKKFIRVIAGLMPGKVRGETTAMVVLAELYRSISPMDLTAVGAFLDNDWENVKRKTAEFARDLQFDTIVVESEEARKILPRRLPEIGRALASAAPKHALTEEGVQIVDAMIAAGKLHLDGVTDDLRYEPEQGAKAIQLAVCYAQLFSAHYRTAPKKAALELKHVWGTTGL